MHVWVLPACMCTMFAPDPCGDQKRIAYPGTAVGDSTAAKLGISPGSSGKAVGALVSRGVSPAPAFCLLFIVLFFLRQGFKKLRLFCWLTCRSHWTRTPKSVASASQVLGFKPWATKPDLPPALFLPGAHPPHCL